MGFPMVEAWLLSFPARYPIGSLRLEPWHLLYYSHRVGVRTPDRCR